MLFIPSTTLLMIASLISLSAQAAATAPNQTPALAVPMSNPDQSVLPPVVDPRKSNCDVQYLNGKRIVSSNTNPQACVKDALAKGMRRRAEAVQMATKAIKLAEETSPQTAPTCVKSVSLKERACLKNNLLKTIAESPEYIITTEDNKVRVYKKDKKILTAIATQSHFIRKPKPPSEQKKILDKAKEAYVFNAIGEVLSTKQTKKKKTTKCICPGQGLPPTTEGGSLLNACSVQDCKNYDLFVNILSNTSVTDGPPSDKPADKSSSAAPASKESEGKTESAPAA